MGIDVSLQNEDGDVIECVPDEKNLLNTLLPREDRSLLAGIDPYGDTTFNRLQIDQFLQEWKELEKKELKTEQAEHLNKIGQLAIKCKSGVHLYLKFVGD
jgi:hypothetical protein